MAAVVSAKIGPADAAVWTKLNKGSVKSASPALSCLASCQSDSFSDIPPTSCSRAARGAGQCAEGAQIRDRHPPASPTPGAAAFRLLTFSRRPTLGLQKKTPQVERKGDTKAGVSEGPGPPPRAGACSYRHSARVSTSLRRTNLAARLINGARLFRSTRSPTTMR